MITVALIGPDGAGKTTVARELERVLDMPVKYLYMGVNWDASEHLLPTTRLVQSIRRRRGISPAGGPPASPPEASRQPLSRRVLRAPWAALSLVNRLAEEWYRQLLAWRYVRAGVVVIFDRHFLADYADDVLGRRRSLDRRIHGILLSRAYPKPDLLVYLDAPAELLFSRKGEGTLASLEARRRSYAELVSRTRDVITVDASRPLSDVTRDVADAIRAFAATRAGQ